jgi:outer membrane protein assembly factor BamB
MYHRISRLILAAFCLATFLTPALLAVDWPQWLGPNRDGVWRETGLLAQFPKDGLKVRWRTPVSGGFSAPAISGGRVFLTDFTPKPDSHRPINPFQLITLPGVERVICLDQATGKILWTHSDDIDYSMSYSAGPRGAPAVDGDRVYTFGGEGNLLCLDCKSGKVIWARPHSQSDSPTPRWGFAMNPLIDGDRLICIIGGNDPKHGHGVVTAFNKLTGAVIWSALSAKEPGYSTPVIYSSGGVRQLIIWDPDAVNSLNPQTGEVYWSHPFGPARMGLCVMTPKFIHDPQAGDVLYVATQYEGSLALKLGEKEPKATVLWQRKGRSDRNTDALHILLSPPVLREGHIYGIDCYGQLRCLDLKTGDRLWETSAATTYDAGPQKWSSAFLIHLGDTGPRYLIANEHGDLILADLDPAGYREISRTHLIDPTNTDPGRPVVWSHPALADRCIFWRNDKEIVCASMAAEAAK